MKIIGITGTNGKTTTASLISSILIEAGHKVAQIGTLGLTAKGFKKRKTLTTPGPVELHKIFNDLYRENFTHVVMEVSSHALDQFRVADVDFDIAVFTNMSEEHLDYHKNMEEYFKAKSKLFQMMTIKGTSVINYEKRYGQKMAKQSAAPVLSFSKKGGADIIFESLKCSLEGIKATVNTGKKSISINSKLIGEFNAENILCSISVSIAMGVDPDRIKIGIERTSNVAGRMELFKTKESKLILIDYAHTPDAYKRVLSMLNQFISDKNKVFVVFGCGGDRDKSKRSEMGSIAEAYSTKIYLTPDNPRNEEVDKINSQIVSGFKRDNFEINNDRGKAIDKAIKEMDSGDLLALLGKGRENFQDIKGEKIPYSDFNIIQNYL